MIPDADVPFVPRNSRMQVGYRVSSENWSRIDELFDKVLDAEDPSLIDLEPDAEVAQAVRLLWKSHIEAGESGFLEQPFTIVRNLINRLAETPHPKDERAFQQGALLGGRFLVKGLLGEGGMGQVYLAQNEKLNKLVALKTIRPFLAQDAEIRRCFVGEIRSAQSVTHPNVCRIFDLFEDGQTAYCSMEYLPGPTLDKFEVEPGSDTAKAIALQLAEGLHAAHINGIIHRDFKPQNVILVPSADGPFPRAVITDFGLARPVRDTGTGVDGEAKNSLRGAGTRDYMAPELLRGDPATFRSDIFAYGKVLARLLPSSRWVVKCLALEPTKRLATLDELIKDLRGESGLSRRTLVMGASFASVSLGAAAYAAYRSKGPRFPLMPTRQRLILNGLKADAGLGDQAYLLRQLLIAGLRQSPMLGVIPDERLLAVLRRLKLSVILPGSLQDLFAVARSEKVAVVVDGAVEKVSSGLRILLRVFEPGATSPALELTRTVDDERQMVGLAQDAALELRREFAESGQSLRASSIPLEQMTSASPEAVDLYFRAVREYERADTVAALAFIDRALAVDSNFVLAHHYRGQILLGASKLQSALQASSVAFEARGRVTNRERNWIEYVYYHLSGDYLRAFASSRTNQTLYPEEALFHRQVATAGCRLQLYPEAIRHSREALDLAPDSPSNHNECVGNLAEADLADEALSRFEQSRKEGMSSPLLFQGAALAWMVRGDYAKADDCITRFREVGSFDRWGRLVQSANDVLQGKFVEAVNNAESDLAYDSEVQEERHRNLRLVYAAWLRRMLGQTDRSLSHLKQVAQLEAVPPSMDYLREAVLPKTASTDAHGFDGEVLSKLRWVESKWPSTHSRGSRCQVEACLAEGAQAEVLYREAMGLWPDPLTIYRFGCWLSQQGRHAEAVEVLARIRKLRGKIIRYSFAGMIGLAGLQQANSCVTLSRFAEAIRVLDQVLHDWGVNARDSILIAEAWTLRNSLRRQ